MRIDFLHKNYYIGENYLFQQLQELLLRQDGDVQLLGAAQLGPRAGPGHHIAGLFGHRGGGLSAPLLDHLIELRTRLVRCVIALGIAFAVCFHFADEIFGFLVRPLTAAFPPGQGKLIYTKLDEALNRMT